MNAIADIVARRTSAPLAPLPALDEALGEVVALFHDQLDSDLPCVDELCRYIERYRGKMLRPTLVLLSGLAAGSRGCVPEAITRGHITVAAVVEMIHIATLVHDDVLDESDTRRGGATVNRLEGNETAVIFGDYLISQAFHLCSTLESQATALRIGRITSTVCEGEMLQLANRHNTELTERDYAAIIERKTASLIAVACELGARHGGAADALAGRMGRFGLDLGAAFQIQDDLLDFVGERAIVGKDLGKDLEKGKPTLPVIHFLRTADAPARAELLELVRLDRPLSEAERGRIAASLAEAGVDRARPGGGR